MGSYFKQFNFVIRHKSRVDNKVPDALSRKVQLLVTLQSEIIGFDFLKKWYQKDDDFEEIWKSVRKTIVKHYHIMDGFLFNENRLCVPVGPKAYNSSFDDD